MITNDLEDWREIDDSAYFNQTRPDASEWKKENSNQMNSDRFIQTNPKTYQKNYSNPAFSLYNGAKDLTAEFERVVFAERKNQVQQIESLQHQLALATAQEVSSRSKVGELQLARLDACNENEALKALIQNAKRRYEVLKSSIEFQTDLKKNQIDFLEGRIRQEATSFENVKAFLEEQRGKEARELYNLFEGSFDTLNHSINDIRVKIAAKENDLKTKEQLCNNFETETGQLVLKRQRIKQLELLRSQNLKSRLLKLANSKQKLLESFSAQINQNVAQYTKSQAEVDHEFTAFDLECEKAKEMLRAIEIEISGQIKANEVLMRDTSLLKVNFEQLTAEGAELQQRLEGREADNLLGIEQMGIQSLDTIERKQQEVKDLDDKILAIEEQIWRLRNSRDEQTRRKKNLHDELRSAITEEFASILKK